jgi:hypothetical protein
MVLIGIIATVAVGLALLAEEPSTVSTPPEGFSDLLTHTPLSELGPFGALHWLCAVLAVLAAGDLWPGCSLAWSMERIRRYRYESYRTWSERYKRLSEYLRIHSQRGARRSGIDKSGP